jgi:hypothetical protein
MARIAQFGIALSALGTVITFMGLFPGVTGVPPTSGIGILQIFTMLMGFFLFFLGALFYIKFTFYVGKPANLAQQIGIRLTLTGLVFLTMNGLADVVGFGSHLLTGNEEPLFGQLQAIGIIGSFALSAIGVLVYAAAGSSD